MAQRICQHMYGAAACLCASASFISSRRPQLPMTASPRPWHPHLVDDVFKVHGDLGGVQVPEVGGVVDQLRHLVKAQLRDTEGMVAAGHARCVRVCAPSVVCAGGIILGASMHMCAACVKFVGAQARGCASVSAGNKTGLSQTEPAPAHCIPARCRLVRLVGKRMVYHTQSLAEGTAAQRMESTGGHSLHQRLSWLSGTFASVIDYMDSG